MNYMDIEEIRNKYSKGYYTCNMVVPKPVGENHVFNINLTIKQNREMIREYNEKVKLMRKEKSAKNSELNHKLHCDVVDYIAHTYGMSKEQASIIENYVYSNNHAFMGDYFYAIDNVAEMVEKVIRCES